MASSGVGLETIDCFSVLSGLPPAGTSDGVPVKCPQAASPRIVPKMIRNVEIDRYAVGGCTCFFIFIL